VSEEVMEYVVAVLSGMQGDDAQARYRGLVVPAVDMYIFRPVTVTPEAKLVGIAVSDSVCPVEATQVWTLLEGPAIVSPPPMNVTATT